MFVTLLAWVCDGDHNDAANAAADLHHAVSLHTIDGGHVYDAILNDSPETDTVEVPGRSRTAMLGQ